MRKIIVIDAETDPFSHGVYVKPFIWGAYEDEFGFRYFDTTAEMIGWVRDQKAVVYAHNGGKFDFLFLLEWFEAHSEIRIINGRIAKFKIGKAEFRDSFLILPVPLKDYKKDKIDYSIMEKRNRDKPENRRKIISYLKTDCEALHELVSAFIKVNGPKLTLASAALSNWRKISGMEAPKTTQNFFETYKPYYYGGRVQCFKKGVFVEPVKVFDINSAYPFAMLAEHPFGTEVFNAEFLPDNDADIARSFMDLTAESHGAFPAFVNGELKFPDDGAVRDFKITGWEYLAARDTGKLRQANVTLCRTFTHSINFASYVNFYFEKKKKAVKNSPEYIQAKLFLNGLYGKFAANPNKYKMFKFIEPQFVDYEEEIGDWRLVDYVGPWALMGQDLPEESKHFYNVATGASITGFVRAMLFRAMQNAVGLKYCDTDSLHASNVPFLKLTKELGDWNVEFEGQRAAYAGKKLYAVLKFEGKKLVDEKIASKGVRLNGAQIFRIAKGGVVRYKQKAPTMSIRRGVSFLTRDIRATG